ncbi:MAG: hypothetical protein RL885_24435 [Planctomycetota bacterium]
MKSLLWIGVVVIATPGIAPAQSAAALPDDPLIRQWVLDVEQVFEAVLEIRYWKGQSLIDYPPAPISADPERILELVDQVHAVLPASDSLARDSGEWAAQLLREPRPLEAASIRDRGRSSDAENCFRALGYPHLGTGPYATPETPWNLDSRDSSWKDFRSDPRQYLAFIRRLRLGTMGRRDILETFLEPLPDLPRVRRAAALYYRWTSGGCQMAPVVGDRYATATILVSTAQCAPDRFTEVFRLVVHPGRWSTLGSAPREGNTVGVLRECFEQVPHQRTPIREYLESLHADYRGRASFWWDYTQEGAPIGADFDDWVTRMLASSETRERRIGLYALTGRPQDQERVPDHLIASVMKGRSWEQIEHDYNQHFECKVQHAGTTTLGGEGTR